MVITLDAYENDVFNERNILYIVRKYNNIIICSADSLHTGF